MKKRDLFNKISMFTNKKALNISGLMYIPEKQKFLYIIILFIFLLTIYHTIIATNI